MDEYISKTDIESVVKTYLNGLSATPYHAIVEGLWVTIDRLPTVIAPVDVRAAYYKGKADGIRKCSKQLENLRQMFEGGTPS